MAILEECCMAFANMQWLFLSDERRVAHGALVSLCGTKSICISLHPFKVFLFETKKKKKKKKKNTLDKKYVNP